MKRHARLTRRPRRLGGRRHAVELIEFTLLLPIAIFFIIFIINLGFLVLTDGILHNAAYTAAETGAQVGSVSAGSQGSTGTAWSSADQTLKNLGIGYSPANLSVTNAIVTTDAGTGSSSVCTAGAGGYTIVTVTLSYQAPLLPGMGTLLSLFSHSANSLPDSNSFTLQATGVARCQIAQS